MRKFYELRISEAPDPRGGTRGATWYFSNKRSARAMRALLLRHVFELGPRASQERCDEAGAYIDITPVTVYEAVESVLEAGDTWPFEELG